MHTRYYKSDQKVTVCDFPVTNFGREFKYVSYCVTIQRQRLEFSVEPFCQ